MNKNVDIDALLAEDKLILTLGGNTYEVDDVNMTVFMMTPNGKDSGDILHKQLAAILKVEKDALKDVGFRAVAFALKEVRAWVTATGFEEEAPSENP